MTDPALIAKGKKLFMEETFEGNGRTCATCHRLENNFTIDPAFIATLPDNDPLFIAEFDPQLKNNFENPKLMREFGLILTNPDGFDDLSNKFAMRSVPHLQGIRTSIDSANGPRLGWSGDGAPGDGSLKFFALGAIKQHMTKTLNRMPGVDFRLPTEDELIAIEAFTLTIGRQEEISLPLPLKGAVALKGQDIFLDNDVGKCNICHINGGASGVFKGVPSGNINFDTGVEKIVGALPTLLGEKMPVDDGFGTPGNGAFNSVSIIESADTAPYMHNNAVSTLEGTVAFYNNDAFNNSKTGKFLAKLDPNGSGIKLNVSQVEAVTVFMRVLNTLENIRASNAFLRSAINPNEYEDRHELMKLASYEIKDAIQVLEQGQIYPKATAQLKLAIEHLSTAQNIPFGAMIKKVMTPLSAARNELINL